MFLFIASHYLEKNFEIIQNNQSDVKWLMHEFVILMCKLIKFGMAINYFYLSKTCTTYSFFLFSTTSSNYYKSNPVF